MPFLRTQACFLTTFSCIVFELCLYLYVIPPELQQCGKSSFHLAEELVEEGQLSHTVLIQQGAQTWHKSISLVLCVETAFYNLLLIIMFCFSHRLYGCCRFPSGGIRLKS